MAHTIQIVKSIKFVICIISLRRSCPMGEQYVNDPNYSTAMRVARSYTIVIEHNNAYDRKYVVRKHYFK